MHPTASAHDIRSRLQRRPDAGRPDWVDSDGKTAAALELIMPTAAQPDMTAEQVARQLREQAARSEARAAAIEALIAAEWTMHDPVARDDGDGYVDVVVTFTKRFTLDTDALDEAKNCGAVGNGWNLGWGYHDGDVLWWTD